MTFLSIFKKCPRTGRITGVNTRAPGFLAFMVSGLAATVWFLVRVIPKPSRAFYPCIQAASPIMSTFVVWVVSLMGIRAFYRKVREHLFRTRYVSAGIFLMGFIFISALFISENSLSIYAQLAPLPKAMAPQGTALGIFPGRVAWVHNSKAALWNGNGTWHSSDLNPQEEYDKAFTMGIENLSGGTGDAEAWDLIFKWFNANHERTGTGYQDGDKIAIKINMNNTANPSQTPGGIDANPFSGMACVRSLVNAGVPQDEIWIGDPSRAVTDNIYNVIHSVYPDVNIVDHHGTDERVVTGTIPDVFPNSDVATGMSACFYDARYLINMPLLKGHVGQGITFGSKNYYGINGISNNWQTNGRHPQNDALVKYMTNPHFGGKTVLWVMDAMYPSRNLGGQPSSGWDGYPFNGKAAASFFMSLDGIAQECVSLDFFYQYYPDKINENGGLGSVEAYIVSAANQGAGVYEHWNNNTDRQYSGNTGGSGIELVYIDAAQTTSTQDGRINRVRHDGPSGILTSGSVLYKLHGDGFYNAKGGVMTR